MTQVPAFNILALGLKSKTHKLIQGHLDPLFKTLYTASMSLQTFLFLSTVFHVYLFAFEPSHSSFSGSAVIVYGTTITTNASGTQDPTWECFIDNISIGWSTAPSSSENNWIICDNILLQDGPHVLTVNANVSNQQTFWFDQIQCTSASDETFLRIDSSNPEIRYSSGWQSLVQLLNTSYTQITGAALTYQFTGS